ncbi:MULTISPECIES: TetR/AcrR family transcriptional regulator [Pseudonocardia]|uniref:HTH-type transcriptional repressor KstR2 n=2 Tax=Pseudonocardia TaxID=1847 RepID=A0A1Y2MZ11_PSEAH|nr:MULTISPECIES: TetR/AcrR family transcriptional regulator [Pseudonocardia]OSY40077.1 HTH-type transcriptional repressor KstR2 [Pseudonocardia autotrophica]TDN72977.1 TetR family transcriptional regulator [Pseudonocardia autotrophica]BBG03697.1 TetR family transcriptional regulator [Pseudonocardia autotrophica]GEC29218.1 TetR family transcriptional regulator [Pseudonocardia saturnea]
MTVMSYDVNRRRVIAVAAELFARNGYHGTGIAELGRAAGLGRGALYHYIGSKEAVLYAISKDQVDSMNAAAEEVLDSGLPADELLREMARVLVRNISDHRSEWAVFFREYQALTGERRDAVVAARERYEGYWRQALDQGVRSGVLRPTPRLLVKGMLGMLNYTYLWFTPDGDLSPEELADLFLDALIDGIRR